MSRSAWSTLYVTTAAASLVFLDNTTMPVALPTIQDYFNFTTVEAVWVVNAYLLSLITLLLSGGRLCDLLGKRFSFLVGFACFGVGALLATSSYAGWMLILGRVVQGAGGALVVPTIGAILIEKFPQGKRAKAIGINTGISSIFMVLGPALGGFLTQYVTWRAIFWINYPIVVFGIIATLILVDRSEKRNETFHYRGAILSSLGVIPLIVGLMQGETWGWLSPWTLGCFALALIFLPLFFAVNAKAEHPIIDLQMFRSRPYRLATVAIFNTQLLLMVTVIWALYFQEYLEFSALKTGLLILTATIGVGFFAPLGGFLADKFGPKLPVCLGHLLLIFSLSWFFFVNESRSFTMYLPGLIPFGCGVTMIFSPSYAFALSAITPAKLGGAAGFLTSNRQFASTLGIAIYTALFQAYGGGNSGSPQGFQAISLVAVILAALGFLFCVARLRKSDR